MKKILVTGSSGQLGAEIIRLLIKNDYQVVGVDLSAGKFTDKMIDITNQEDVLEVSQKLDAIIHTASLHGRHYEQQYSREAFVRTNILGTLNLLNACVQNGIPKLVYTSTTSLYGHSLVDDKQAVWVTEELIPQPRDIYDITKISAEMLCKDFFEKENIETVSLRISRFFPESENSKVLYRLYRGLSEEDGAAAHLLALESKMDNFEVFNISSLSPFQQEDLEKLYHSPKEVILKYYPEAKAIFQKKAWEFPQKIDRVYVIDKARRLLGYTPRYNFDYLLNEGLED